MSYPQVTQFETLERRARESAPGLGAKPKTIRAVSARLRSRRRRPAAQPC